MGIKIERKGVSLGSGKIKLNRVRPDEMAPNFESLFDPSGVPNPLERLRNTGDVTENAEQEVSAALAAIKAEKKERRDQYRTVTDPNYYVVVVFQNSAQRDEFLGKSGWDQFGQTYIDGLALAGRLGVDIEPINLPRKLVKPAPKALRGSKFIDPNEKGGE